jgi:Ca-activated chloride channel homolog
MRGKLFSGFGRLAAPSSKLRAAFALLAVVAASQSLAQQPAQQPSPAQKQPAQSPTQAAEDDEVIRVETSLVTVAVGVTDGQGRFVAGLRPGQFRLFEDGVEQEIAHFESAERPFTVALLLDVSASVEGKLREIAAAARAFVESLRPEDRVLLLAAFDERLYLLAEGVGDRRAASDALARLRTGGGTRLRDAVGETLRVRLGKTAGRKAVVLFTDGIDTASRASQEETLRAAEESDALVYAVQFDPTGYAARAKAFTSGNLEGSQMTTRGESLSAAYQRGTTYLRLLADKSGGRYFEATSVRKLSETFARVGSELRQQYSLGYYPKERGEAGRPRKIAVRVDAPGATVRARKGYVFKPRKGSRRDLPAGRDVARGAAARG